MTKLLIWFSILLFRCAKVEGLLLLAVSRESTVAPFCFDSCCGSHLRRHRLPVGHLVLIVFFGDRLEQDLIWLVFAIIIVGDMKICQIWINVDEIHRIQRVRTSWNASMCQKLIPSMGHLLLSPSITFGRAERFLNVFNTGLLAARHRCQRSTCFQLIHLEWRHGRRNCRKLSWNPWWVSFRASNMMKKTHPMKVRTTHHPSVTLAMLNFQHPQDQKFIIPRAVASRVT